MDRSKSVLVRIGTLDVRELLYAILDELGEETILGARMVGPQVAEITLKDKDLASKLVELGSIKVQNNDCEIRSVSARILTIYLRGLPLETPDHVVERYLTAYGKIVSAKRGHFKEERIGKVENGLRIIRLETKKSPPNLIRMGDFNVRVSYEGVTLICTKCGKEGHFSGDCPKPSCLNCGNSDHKIFHCKNPCRKCNTPDHTLIECERKTFAEALQISLEKNTETPNVDPPNKSEGKVSEPPMGAVEENSSPENVDIGTKTSEIPDLAKEPPIQPSVPKAGEKPSGKLWADRSEPENDEQEEEMIIGDEGYGKRKLDRHSTSDDETSSTISAASFSSQPPQKNKSKKKNSNRKHSLKINEFVLEPTMDPKRKEQLKENLMYYVNVIKSLDKEFETVEQTPENLQKIKQRYLTYYPNFKSLADHCIENKIECKEAVKILKERFEYKVTPPL